MPTYPAIPDVTKKSTLNVQKALKEGYEISQGYYDSDDAHQSYTDIDDDLKDPNKYKIINVGATGKICFGDQTKDGSFRVKREDPALSVEAFSGTNKSWSTPTYIYSGQIGSNAATDGTDQIELPTGAPNWGSFIYGNGNTTFEYGHWRCPGTGGWLVPGTEIMLSACTDLTSPNVSANNSAVANSICVIYSSGAVNIHNNRAGGTICIFGHFNQTT
ncbi:MAG: hypothetical protein GY841_16120 [FCB group bacterium]|nr:hypothetical protein [FCB group bacterium]